MLHGIHCIQSCCIISTAFKMFHFFTLHGIHCIQSGCIGPHCMDSTAFNQDAFYNAACITMHSITMHGIHCIPSGCFGPCLIKSTEFNRDALGLAAWTPLHTIRIHCATMHGILAFIDAACNPLYSIGMLWAMLHKIHCTQSCCIKSTAYNRVP